MTSHGDAHSGTYKYAQQGDAIARSELARDAKIIFFVNENFCKIQNRKIGKSEKTKFRQ